jgi:hypothetical protein
MGDFRKWIGELKILLNQLFNALVELIISKSGPVSESVSVISIPVSVQRPRMCCKQLRDKKRKDKNDTKSKKDDRRDKRDTRDISRKRWFLR